MPLLLLVLPNKRLNNVPEHVFGRHMNAIKIAFIICCPVVYIISILYCDIM